MNEHLAFELALILAAGISAQWIASRLRVPSILLLLGAGILVGPMLGWLHPDQLLGPLLAPVVSVSVGLILYEGGLTLHLAELRQSGSTIRNLVTIGALVTWAVGLAAARWLLGLDWGLSALLGAVLVVTGPTVIGPLLRHVRPTGASGPILKWEGIVIDPIGATLALLVFEAVVSRQGAVTGFLLAGMVRTLLAGLACGSLAAGTLLLLLRRRWVPDVLQNPMSLMLAVVAFVGANHVQDEAGLLATTVMGLLLANQRWVSVHHIVEFKENLRVLLIGGLFVLLAARLQPAALAQFGWRGLAFVAALVFIARPAAVWLSTLRAPLSSRERLFLSWMAPRGIVAAAVASIFAIRLTDEGFADAAALADATFLVIICTVTLYGVTAAPVARMLGIAEAAPQGILLVGAHHVARALATALQAHGLRVLMVDTNAAYVLAAKALGLEARQANVLDEDLVDDLDLSGIGRALALTSNDEVNALSALALSEAFGRNEVFQLPQADSSTYPMHRRGRIAFGDAITFHALNDRFAEGATVQTLDLTAPLAQESVQAEHGPDALPLFVIDGVGRLRVVTARQGPQAQAGDRLVVLMPAAAAGPRATPDS